MDTDAFRRTLTGLLIAIAQSSDATIDEDSHDVSTMTAALAEVNGQHVDVNDIIEPTGVLIVALVDRLRLYEDEDDIRALLRRHALAEARGKTECPTCHRIMLDTDGCDPRPDSILFGDEIPDDPEWRADLPKRCHDCEALQGHAHHHGCCVQLCAGCDTQRLLCPCDDLEATDGHSPM